MLILQQGSATLLMFVKKTKQNQKKGTEGKESQSFITGNQIEKKKKRCSHLDVGFLSNI